MSIFVSPGRRRIILSTPALWAGFGSARAQEQGGRNRTTRLVVPFPPGGSTDALARVLAPRLAERLGETITVENKPGAGGNLGAAAVAREPESTNTFLVAATSVVINPTIYAGNSPFQLFRELLPVTKLVDIPCAILVGPSMPAKTMAELVAVARSKAGGLTLASAGFGTVPHVAGEYLKSATGVDMTHVPHKGQADMLRELMAGRADVAVDLLAGSLPFVQAGRLRALAVTSTVRQEALADVPTADEAGLKGFVVSAHQSMWAPLSTPAARIEQMNRAVAGALAEAELAQALKRMLMTPAPTPVADTERYMKSEVTKWAAFARAGDATRQ